MPMTTETAVEAFAHCPDPLCAGHEQAPVPGVKMLVATTIGDRGGDGVFVNIVENTHEYLRFAEPEDVACPECGRDREVALQQRPVYDRLIGPPDALLRARRAGLGGPKSAQAVGEAAAETASREPTARERLDMRFVNGEVDDKEYFAKRAILDGGGGT